MPRRIAPSVAVKICLPLCHLKRFKSMPDQSFRNHLQNLEQQGELIRVDRKTDPHENVSAIGWKTYDRFEKSTLFLDQ